jgi:hypothetical protein
MFNGPLSLDGNNSYPLKAISFSELKPATPIISMSILMTTGIFLNVLYAALASFPIKTDAKPLACCEAINRGFDECPGFNTFR